MGQLQYELVQYALVREAAFDVPWTQPADLLYVFTYSLAPSNTKAGLQEALAVNTSRATAVHIEIC